MTKWVSRILMGVIAGVVVWFLTQSSYSPFTGPKVELVDLNFPERILAGEEFGVSFWAKNQRDKPERDCHGFVAIWPRKNDGSATSNSSETTVAVADCRTQNPRFHLGSLSGSSVQILVDCRVRKPGIYRMIYGISCRSGPDSKWQLDHQTYIEVEEP